MSTDQAIKPLIEKQSPESPRSNPSAIDQEKINAEKELADCLQVPELSDSDSEASVVSHTAKRVPKTLKTRSDLIRKIKESAEVLGNHEDIKKMCIHRRRKNSLSDILKEQIGRCVQKSAERDMGIPQDKDKRLDYAVNCLYKFDLCIMSLVEKVVEYCDIGLTCEGFATTIDRDSEIKVEVKDAIKDFILEGEYDFIKEYASPGTRLIIAHMYPLMSVLRKKEETQKVREIVPGMGPQIAIAKMRSLLRPPKTDSPPTIKATGGRRPDLIRRV